MNYYIHGPKITEVKSKAADLGRFSFEQPLTPIQWHNWELEVIIILTTTKKQSYTQLLLHYF